jgi:hypothetical protein
LSIIQYSVLNKKGSHLQWLPQSKRSTYSSTIAEIGHTDAQVPHPAHKS